MVEEVADGKRGAPPDTVTFLGGDVHHSYLAEVRREHWAGSSRIVQAVCSPIRNPLPRKMRFVTAAAGLRGRRPDGEARRPLRQGRGRSVPVEQHRRPVVRQQHRGARGAPRRVCRCAGTPGSSRTATTMHPRLHTIADELIRPQVTRTVVEVRAKRASRTRLGLELSRSGSALGSSSRFSTTSIRAGWIQYWSSATSRAVCPKAIACTIGCTRLEACAPSMCAPRICPFDGSASTFAKPVVSSIAQP